MKSINCNLLLLLFAVTGFFLIPDTASAQATSGESVPEIVDQCKDLNDNESEAFTLRINALDQDKKEVLDGLIFHSYGKKNLPYQKVHLEMLLKLVENYSAEKTKESLAEIRKASGQ